MNSKYLQSLNWQKICQARNPKTIILSKEENHLKFSSLLIEEKIRFFPNSYYCPRGPIINSSESLELWQVILKTWVEQGRKFKAFFIKLDPSLINLELFKKAAQSLGLKIKRVKSRQPQQTVYLDLNLSEEDLLRQMKAKTRYNIKVALRHNLSLRDDKNDFEDFFKLLSATKDRDAFRLHPKNHYLNLINNGVRLISIKKDQTMLAAGLFVFYQDTATYLHGASNYQYRSKMAPYLLHWELIKKAKAENLKYYDFYGIDEKNWPGVTRFKRGFGGKELNYPDSYDIILKQPYYSLYNNLKNIKKSLRWK